MKYEIVIKTSKRPTIPTRLLRCCVNILVFCGCPALKKGWEVFLQGIPTAWGRHGEL